MSARVHVCVCVHSVCALAELTPWPQLSNKNLVDSAHPAPSALRSACLQWWGCAGGSSLCWGMRTCCFRLRGGLEKTAATAGRSLGLNHQCLGPTPPPHLCYTLGGVLRAVEKVGTPGGPPRAWLLDHSCSDQSISSPPAPLTLGLEMPQSPWACRPLSMTP